MLPTKENTLYLIINQSYFDAILNGSKKQEYREIKDSTYQKYLDTWKNKDEIVIYFDKNKISEEEYQKYPNNPMIYNNGIYPYIPIPYKFIDFTVGYNNERDTMLVAIEDIYFEPIKDKSGEEARFSDDEEIMRVDKNGELCIWQIVYTLGKTVNTDLKENNESVE